MEGQVGDPGIFPCQVFVAGLYRGHTGISHIIIASADQGLVFIIRNLRVAGCSAAERYLRIGQPISDSACKSLIPKVPHQAD